MSKDDGPNDSVEFRLIKVLSYLNVKFDRKTKLKFKSPSFLGRFINGQYIHFMDIIILYRPRLDILVHEFGHAVEPFHLAYMNPAFFFFVAIVSVWAYFSYIIPLPIMWISILLTIFIIALIVSFATNIFYKIDPRERFANRFLARNIEECKQLLNARTAKTSLDMLGMLTKKLRKNT